MSGEVVPLRETTADLTRPPPANLEAEATLLGALLVENALFDTIADIIGASDFYESVHQRIYEVALVEVMAGRPATPVTLRGRFPDDEALTALGGPAYLARLTGTRDHLVDAPDLARLLADLSRRRRIIEKLHQASAQAHDENAPLSDITELIEQAAETPGGSAARVSSAADCLHDLIQNLDKPIEGATCGLIPSFDELHGPMEPSQMIVLAGRPGMGKTAAGLTYALGAAKKGHGVLFISLEMNRRQLAGRMAADLCFEAHQIPYAAIRDRRVSVEQRRHLSNAWSQICTLPLTVIDAGEMSTGALNAAVRSHSRRFATQGKKLSLVVVDYLQLLRPSQRTNGRYEAVSEVSRALKAIAKDNDLAVLALAQLSRATETRTDKRPQLSDLRDSGQIEQDADSVMFLHREEYYLGQANPLPGSDEWHKQQAALELVKGKIDFILAKRRNGVTGVSTGTFYGAYQAVR